MLAKKRPWRRFPATMRLLLLLPLLALNAHAFSPEELQLSVEARGVLAHSCTKCHGQQKQKGGLRLDTKEAALKGGDDGIVVPIVFGSLIGSFVVLLLCRFLVSFIASRAEDAHAKAAEAAIAKEIALAKIRMKDGPSAAERKQMRREEKRKKREAREARLRAQAEKDAEMAALAASSDDEEAATGDAKV